MVASHVLLDDGFGYNGCFIQRGSLRKGMVESYCGMSKIERVGIYVMSIVVTDIVTYIHS